MSLYPSYYFQTWWKCVVKEREMGQEPTPTKCCRRCCCCFYVFLVFSRGESLMISLYRQHDYSHHSSAQWKPWDALRCLPNPSQWWQATECTQFEVGLTSGFGTRIKWWWCTFDSWMITQHRQTPGSCWLIKSKKIKHFNTLTHQLVSRPSSTLPVLVEKGAGDP